MHNRGFYEKNLKRVFDLLLSILALIIFSPFLLIVALIVRKKIGSPIFFKQERPGENSKIFRMYKFRTMTNERNIEGDLLPDNERVTKFGSFLRTTSMDELPGLINILIGDMSIVGPRPLLVEYLLLYNEKQMRRHEVKPGLSGLAQVNGRNAINWNDKFELDVKYVDSITLRGDIKIILQTVFKVIKRSGITSNTSVTMEKFKGKNIEN